MKTIIICICLILLSGCVKYDINVTVLAPPENQVVTVPVNVYVVIKGNSDDDSTPFDVKASGIPTP